MIKLESYQTSLLKNYSNNSSVMNEISLCIQKRSNWKSINTVIITIDETKKTMKNVNTKRKFWWTTFFWFFLEIKKISRTVNKGSNFCPWNANVKEIKTFYKIHLYIPKILTVWIYNNNPEKTTHHIFSLEQYLKCPNLENKTIFSPICNQMTIL